MPKKHKYGSNVGLARRKLETLVKVLENDGFTIQQRLDLCLDQIKGTIPLLKREVLSPATRHPSKRLSADKKLQIVAMHKEQDGKGVNKYTQQEIAVKFGVNSGRIAEVIRAAKKSGRY